MGQRLLVGVVALGLVASCSAPTATGGGTSRPRPVGPVTGGGLGTLQASADPQASTGGPAPDPIGTPALADFRGRVLLPDGQPAVGVQVSALLITDNGAGLLGNNAAGLVGAGGGLLGNNAAGLVGAGGGLVGNNAAGLVGAGGGLTGSGTTSYRLQGVHPMVRRLMAEGLSATTDAEGKYRLDLPATGSYNLESGLGDGSLKAIAQEATQASGPVNLTLAKPGKLAMSVKAESGTVTDFTNTQVYIPGTQYSGMASQSGQLLFDSLPPGRFTFISVSSRLGKGILEGVEVRSGQTLTEARPLILKRPPVKILAIQPSVFTVGDLVTIRGEGFGFDAGSLVKATLAGRALSGLRQLDNANITFTAPATAESGDLQVEVDGFPSNVVHAKVAKNLEAVTPRQAEVGTGFTMRVAAILTDNDKVATAPVAFRLTKGTGVAEVSASGVVTPKAVGQAEVEVSLGSLRLPVPVSVVAQGTLSGLPGTPSTLVDNLVDMALDAGRGRLVLANANNLIAFPLTGGAPSLVAGNPTPDSASADMPKDGNGSAARMGDINAVACAADGRIRFLDVYSLLRGVDLSGVVTTLAGREDGEDLQFGTGVGASLGFPENGLGVLGDGSALFTSEQKLVRVNEAGEVKAFTLTPATPAPTSVEVATQAPDGSVWLADFQAIYRVQADGTSERLVRSNTTGWTAFFSGGGSVKAMALDPNGAVWVLSEAGCLMHRPQGSTTWQQVLAPQAEGAEASDGALGPGNPGRFGEVTGMAADAMGRLWLLCDGKLCRIDTPLNNPSLTTVLRAGLPLAVHRIPAPEEE